MRTLFDGKNRLTACFIGAAMMFGACGMTPHTHAQGYQPARPGDASLTNQNHHNFGQRIDLDIEFEYEFDTEPCPAPSDKEVIKTCTISVTFDWISVPVYTPFFGVKNWHQNHCGGDEDSPDQFVIYWEGFLNWTLRSAHRDGVSILGQANPEAAAFGNGTIDGLQMEVPSGFETGATGHGPTTYVFVLEYVPDDSCTVMPLIVGGHYIHTYVGDFWIAVRPKLGIRPVGGVPGLAANVAGNLDWGWYSRAWQMALFNPGGHYHKKKLTPPENCVPHEGCCDQEAPDPPRHANIMSEVTRDLWDEVTIMTTVEPTDEPLTSVSILGWTANGIQFGDFFHLFEKPSWQTEEFEVTFQLPADCDTENLHFETIARTLNSAITGDPLLVEDRAPYLPRFITNDAIIDSRLVAPSILVAEIPVPQGDPSSIAELNHVYVVDQVEQVVDEEAPFKIVDNGDSYLLYYQVADSAVRTPGNGILEVLNHDFVQLFSQTSAEWDAIGINVITDNHVDTLNIFGSNSSESDLIQMLGTATGGTFRLGFGNHGATATLTTTPGASSEETASQVVNAINALGLTDIQAVLHEPDTIRLDGEHTEVTFHMVDGGIDLRCPAYSDPGRPADFDNNGVVNGADLGLFLNAMASPPSDIGPFDLTGDGQIDAADLGMVLADWG